MIWLALSGAPQRRGVLRLARRLGVGPPRDLRTAGDRVDADGIAVIGTDADLAAVAFARCTAGQRLPLALVPTRRSDLLRMFAVDRSDLSTGEPYRADLGVASSGDAIVPFVSHFTARPRFGRTGRVAISSHRSWEVEGWRCVVANAQHLEDATIAPRAALMDGELDIQVHAGSRRRIRRLARRGLHLGEPTVWRRSVASATITPPSGWLLRADGRRIGTGTCEVRTEIDAFDLWV